MSSYSHQTKASLNETEEEIIQHYSEGNPTASEIADGIDHLEESVNADDIAEYRSGLVEEGLLEQEWRGSGTEYNPAKGILE